MRGYQLKITIKGSSPPVWRRVIVPGDICFADLDQIIECIFGWTHSHLYCFEIPGSEACFGGPSEMGEGEAEAERIDLWFHEKAELRYIYDLGDNWEHIILVEKILDYDKEYAQVVKAKGPNMLEDCGGLAGFYENIEYAEPFDLEKTNACLKTYRSFFPEAGSGQGRFSLQPQPEDNGTERRRNRSRYYPEPEESLAEVFRAYRKEDLIEIARANDFSGAGKMKKAELIQWLRERLLEPEHLRRVLEEADREDVRLFQEAVEKKGIWADDELIFCSPLLSFYCGFRENGFLTVPKDAEERFREVYDRKFQKELEKRWELSGYCRSAVCLYGVIKAEDLAEIYKGYEHKRIKAEDMKNVAAQYPGEMAVKDGYIMDPSLEEEDMYGGLLRNQGQLPYYLPEDKEKFLEYGELECQEPDEDTWPLLEFFTRVLGQDIPRSMILFYQVQELIKKNYLPEEITDAVLDICGKKGKSLKKRLAGIIAAAERYIRIWENRGFTEQELEEMRKTGPGGPDRCLLAGAKKTAPEKGKIIPFPGEKNGLPQ